MYLAGRARPDYPGFYSTSYPPYAGGILDVGKAIEQGIVVSSFGESYWNPLDDWFYVIVAEMQGRDIPDDFLEI